MTEELPPPDSLDRSSKATKMEHQIRKHCEKLRGYDRSVDQSWTIAWLIDLRRR